MHRNIEIHVPNQSISYVEGSDVWKYIEVKINCCKKEYFSNLEKRYFAKNGKKNFSR